MFQNSFTTSNNLFFQNISQQESSEINNDLSKNNVTDNGTITTIPVVKTVVSPEEVSDDRIGKIQEPLLNSKALTTPDAQLLDIAAKTSGKQFLELFNTIHLHER